MEPPDELEPDEEDDDDELERAGQGQHVGDISYCLWLVQAQPNLGLNKNHVLLLKLCDDCNITHFHFNCQMQLNMIK